MSPSTYTIGAVAKITGISTHTLRAWERRHGIAPTERSDSGRRQYTDADIQKLTLLKQLTDQGQAISSLADLSFDALLSRTQLDSNQSRATSPQQTPYRIALFGEYITHTFTNAKQALKSIDVVISESSKAKFKTNLKKLKPQVIVMELDVLDEATVAFIHDCLKLANPDKALISYKYGRPDQIQKISKTIALFKQLVFSPQFIHDFLARSITPNSQVVQNKPPAAKHSDSVKPRLFTDRQLFKLAQVTSSVDCECPHHLVGIIRDLLAFETYSEQCENQNKDDAALHAYLHTTTSHVRHTMELALQKVARAEGIDV